MYFILLDIINYLISYFKHKWKCFLQGKPGGESNYNCKYRQWIYLLADVVGRVCFSIWWTHFSGYVANTTDRTIDVHNCRSENVYTNNTTSPVFLQRKKKRREMTKLAILVTHCQQYPNIFKIKNLKIPTFLSAIMLGLS